LTPIFLFYVVNERVGQRCGVTYGKGLSAVSVPETKSKGSNDSTKFTQKIDCADDGFSSNAFFT
jgi:hypothetical protein